MLANFTYTHRKRNSMLSNTLKHVKNGIIATRQVHESLTFHQSLEQKQQENTGAFHHFCQLTLMTATHGQT